MDRIFYDACRDANFRLKVEWGHRSVEEEDAMAAMELRHHSQGKRFISGHCIHRTISKKILRENLHENRNYFRISYIYLSNTHLLPFIVKFRMGLNFGY